MSDAGFIIAGYGVILGGMGLYVAVLVRRLRIARQALRRDAEAAPPEIPR
jgi:hypothetical protein